VVVPTSKMSNPLLLLLLLLLVLWLVVEPPVISTEFGDLIWVVVFFSFGLTNFGAIF
jgi:hypothetical protein